MNTTNVPRPRTERHAPASVDANPSPDASAAGATVVPLRRSPAAAIPLASDVPALTVEALEREWKATGDQSGPLHQQWFAAGCPPFPEVPDAAQEQRAADATLKMTEPTTPKELAAWIRASERLDRDDCRPSLSVVIHDAAFAQ